MNLDGQGADEVKATGLVGEDAEHVGPPFELFVEPLQHVGRLHVFVVLERQPESALKGLLRGARPLETFLKFPPHRHGLPQMLLRITPESVQAKTGSTPNSFAPTFLT
jgi:hypothetical protein